MAVLSTSSALAQSDEKDPDDDVEQPGRPADYYTLTYARDHEVCDAFADAAAPARLAHHAPSDPALGTVHSVTRDDQPWGSHHDGRSYPGYAKYWVVADLDNSGSERAVLQLVWKGHRWLYVLANSGPSARVALARAFDLLAEGRGPEQVQLVDLRVATQIREDVLTRLHKTIYEETSLETYSVVQLRGRNYLSAYTTDVRGRPALLLVGFTATSRAQLLCILAWTPDSQ